MALSEVSIRDGVSESKVLWLSRLTSALQPVMVRDVLAVAVPLPLVTLSAFRFLITVLFTIHARKLLLVISEKNILKSYLFKKKTTTLLLLYVTVLVS